MSLSDPIADMLTRVRNAHRAGHDVVEVPHSRMKGEIARILKSEGFIRDYMAEGRAPKVLKIYLKYDANHQPVIQGIRRESRPGLRRYANTRKIPKILGGLGLAILSTPAGVITDKEARKQHVGGEVLCCVW